jgi:anti-sigma regulatory factor (Ser/Thr protein kinase)
VSLRYERDATAAARARRALAAEVVAAGFPALADDAALLVSELVANAVLHARTDVEVRLVVGPDGVRVEVLDGSPVLPLPGALAATAMSGRGLLLVEGLAPRWGVEAREGGKAVWFELGGDVPGGREVDAEDLVELWSRGEGDAGGAPVGGAEPPERSVVLPDVPVAQLIAAKSHMEDLVRELRLLLVDAARARDARVEGGGDGPDAGALLVARRLDAAVEGFAQGRLQLRSQGMRAAARGARTVTLELSLPVSAADAAEDYLRAVEAAAALREEGGLLSLAGGLHEYADLRRWYLEEITRQLRAQAGGGAGPGQRPLSA